MISGLGWLGLMLVFAFLFSAYLGEFAPLPVAVEYQDDFLPIGLTVGELFWFFWGSFTAALVVGFSIGTLLWMERRTYFTIIQTLESQLARPQKISEEDEVETL
jgi:hypothetical protein